MNPPVVIGLLLDWLLGDPLNRFHPTAWMGGLIAAADRIRPYGRPALEFIAGIGLTLLGTALTGMIGWVLTEWFDSFPAPLGWLASAVILKASVSLRGLDRAAGEVQIALESRNLAEARRKLSRHLVSRETALLAESQAAGAAVESVAENASDGVVAPMFFFAVGGLPAALAYRFVNTADSMLGYRDPPREWYGKFPARLDDLLNFIPSRLTGLLLTAAAFLARENGPRAWRIMRRDARLAASPNAGVPTSAMAGALGARLEKAGHYSLGGEFPSPSAGEIRRARRLLQIASILAATFLFPLPAAGWWK
ncbi:MAG: cobalamin biosynthesis protein CobD [Anaerolineales bacterium]|nr:cobalamin biosynthesis protein CobD [Anaerolineales bacterium]